VPVTAGVVARRPSLRGRLLTLSSPRDRVASVLPFGHAGGGDEMLLVLLPLLVFMIVYRLARGPLPEDRAEERRR
jgi:hypothetical protein